MKDSITSIFVDIFNTMFPQFAILIIVYIVVLIAIFLDLLSGIKKAKLNGEHTTSYGYRRTVNKIISYYLFLFGMTLIDVLQMLTICQINERCSCRIPLIPIITYLTGIFVVFIEIKSVYENHDKKMRNNLENGAKTAADGMRIILKLAKDKDFRELLDKFLQEKNKS